MKRALEYLRTLITEKCPISYEAGKNKLLSITDMFDDIGLDAYTLYNTVMDEIEFLETELCDNADDELNVFIQAVISVLCCLLYSKFSDEEVSQTPQDLENIQGEKLDAFYDQLYSKKPTAKDCFRYFCSEVCL